MVKRTILIAFTAALAAGVVSCKKSKPDTTANQQAKFQAEQKARALKTYQELVKKYPDSEHAPKAQERIRALATPAGPATT
jgi:outer membrane protein assembly factor BamD (BamD/ComL family)